MGERMRDININDGAEEYGQQQQPARSYSPQGAGEQVSQLLSPCLLLPGAPACALSASRVAGWLVFGFQSTSAVTLLTLSQVHMPSQYAPVSSQPQHTLSSGDDAGLGYTGSAEQPLTATRSMAEEPAAVVAAAAAPVAPAAAGSQAAGLT